MTPEEIRKMRQINFRQTNAFAMQNGLILGVYANLVQSAFVLGLSRPGFSHLHLLLLFGFPLMVCVLTRRFRQTVAQNFPFSFSRGFSHALLTTIYAGIWAGAGVFVYLFFFDKGYVFDAYQANLTRPEVIEAMQQSGLDDQVKAATGGKTPLQLVDELRSVSAATYAAMVIYFYLLSSPLLGVWGGLCNIRSLRSLQR